MFRIVTLMTAINHLIINIKNKTFPEHALSITETVYHVDTYPVVIAKATKCA